jgi:hypothetical protein
MARISRIQWRALSRRTVVIQSMACAAGAAALLGAVKEAAAKMAQKAVQYQDTPKGDQQCSNCSLFQEPNSARWSTVKLVRQAGVNSGSKRLANSGWLLHDVGENLLICVKAGLFERVHTVKAQGKSERSCPNRLAPRHLRGSGLDSPLPTAPGTSSPVPTNDFHAVGSNDRSS